MRCARIAVGPFGDDARGRTAGTKPPRYTSALPGADAKCVPFGAPRQQRGQPQERKTNGNTERPGRPSDTREHKAPKTPEQHTGTQSDQVAPPPKPTEQQPATRPEPETVAVGCFGK